MCSAWWEEFHKPGSLCSGEPSAFKLDASIVGAGLVRVGKFFAESLWLGASRPDDGVLVLGTAMAFAVLEVDVEVRGAAIVQSAGDGAAGGSPTWKPWCSSPVVKFFAVWVSVVWKEGKRLAVFGWG